MTGGDGVRLSDLLVAESNRVQYYLMNGAYTYLKVV